MVAYFRLWISLTMKLINLAKKYSLDSDMVLRRDEINVRMLLSPDRNDKGLWNW